MRHESGPGLPAPLLSRVSVEGERLLFGGAPGLRPPATDLADALIAMARRILAAPAERESELFGTFHFCGTGWTTWYGFAHEIFALARVHGGGMPGLRPIATLDYPTPAVRPANSVLNCQHLADVYGITAPDWRKSLRDCVAKLCAEVALEEAA